MQSRRSIDQVIATLRRQRVRQGDLQPVLECVVAQALVLKKLAISDVVTEMADEIAARARELNRMHSSLPKFVVEELLEESIARLEQASPPPAAGASRK